ncbi:lysophospholipid acyltransferase family protein [Novipirellula caenicola]|uniref:Phospholipid/glycerol acyltransferase domain-containing protein n=1 Tax=Novipirellula caenicola TaxID=1536901 RepID=A0ABP9VHT1_9BACT
MTSNASDDAMRPDVSGWLSRGFHRFLTPYLRRNFHSIAMMRDSLAHAAVPEGEPLILCANHPSWWDPLTAQFLNQHLFPTRQFFAPIDAAALEQYRVFAKLGFYGVKLHSSEGAAAFLKQSRAILHSGDAALWLTPEGRFADVRDHSAVLMPGMAHLCARMQSGYVLPIAIEYVFWEERLPECLFRVGEPFRIADHPQASKMDWQTRLTERMRENQSVLSERVIARDSQAFENILSGARGAGFVYDSMRRIKALVTGRRFKASHGNKLQ